MLPLGGLDEPQFKFVLHTVAYLSREGNSNWQIRKDFGRTFTPMIKQRADASLVLPEMSLTSSRC